MEIRFKTIARKLNYYIDTIEDWDSIVDIALTESEHKKLCDYMGADVTRYRSIKISVMKD